MSESPRTIVLLTPPAAAAAPPAFMQACGQRGVNVRHVVEPATVIVELHRGADGLIVIDPDAVERIDDLLAAVRTYYPHVDCRQYRRGPTRGGEHGGERDTTFTASDDDDDGAPSAAMATAMVTEAELAMLFRPLELDAE